MKWFLIISVSVLIIACKTKTEKGINSTPFIHGLESIEYTGNYENTSFIILHSSECRTYFQILEYLDQKYSDKKQMRLIIIDPFHKRFQQFIDQHQIEMPAYRDSSGTLISDSAIPYTPVVASTSENGERVFFYELDEYMQTNF